MIFIFYDRNFNLFKTFPGNHKKLNKSTLPHVFSIIFQDRPNCNYSGFFNLYPAFSVLFFDLMNFVHKNEVTLYYLPGNIDIKKRNTF